MKRFAGICLLAGIGFGQLAWAQGAEDEGATLDEITVTGSRIRKQDYNSNSPVTSVDSEQFEQATIVDVDDLVNTLPQVIPGRNSTNNAGGRGSASIDLRGLGSNRTLVLINGRRAMPSGDDGVVDINSIIPSTIERVEVLTGGASSVYGADAVAGVVNFILKRNFTGVEINGGYSTTDEGDANVVNTNITLGGDIDGGRGNVMLSLDYVDRDPLLQGERDFSFFALDGDDAPADPSIWPFGLLPRGSTRVPASSISDSGFRNGVLGSSRVIFDQDGSVRAFDSDPASPGFDRYNFAPEQFLRMPQERFSMASSAHYDVSDKISFFAEARFIHSDVQRQLAPTPNSFRGNIFTLDGNPFLTPGAQQIISDAIGLGVDTDGDGIDDQAEDEISRRMNEVGPRQSTFTNDTYQLLAGFEGTLSDSWYYDVSYSTGRTSDTGRRTNAISRERFNQALLLETDAAGNVVLDANGQPSCADPSAGGSQFFCSPANVFGAGNISAAAADFLHAIAIETLVTEQDIFQANVAGDFGSFSITDEPIQVAFGVEYIDNAFDLDASQNQIADIGSNDPRGLEGSTSQRPISDGYDVTSAYGELSIPLLSGLPGAEAVVLDLAFRVADYSTLDDTQTNFKVGGEWVINDQVRFRGNFNTAIRAPNIGELFAPITEGFSSGGNDPCSAAFLGGNPIDPAVADICIANGVPAASVGTTDIDLVSLRSLSGGNPDLGPEEADTITAGFVITPAAIENLRFSVDYFDIEIDDFIADFGGSTSNILSTCFDPNDPQGGIGSDFCNAVHRFPDGKIDFVSTREANSASFQLTGIDIGADYSFDTSFGLVNIHYLATLTDKSEFLDQDGGEPLDCAGYFGEFCGEPIPEYKHRATIAVSGDTYGYQLTWRMIGAVDDGGLLRDDPQVIPKIDAAHYLDVSGSYDFNDSFRLTGGIRNILDESPPIVGNVDFEDANTFPGTYDVYGPTFHVTLKVTF